jgi:predicted phage-related endonuclease
MTAVQEPSAWLRTMSASKIAAVVGLSPYESRFSLYHRMAGLIPAQEDDPALRRGHYLEPAVMAWFRDQHPTWEITAAQATTPDEWLTLPDGRRHPVWRSAMDPIFTASPDGFALTEDGRACVEVKTASDSDEWGAPGTDEIPKGYLTQVQWQMGVLGLPRTYVAVLTAYLDLREYVVDFDPEDWAYLTAEAHAFLDSLPGGSAEQKPDIDRHTATYEAVKQLHPEIEDRKVELDADLVREYCTARHALTHAEARLQQATSRVADALGNAKTGTYLGQTIARRQAKREGTPFLVAGRALPTFDTAEEAA